MQNEEKFSFDINVKTLVYLISDLQQRAGGAFQ